MSANPPPSDAAPREEALFAEAVEYLGELLGMYVFPAHPGYFLGDPRRAYIYARLEYFRSRLAAPRPSGDAPSRDAYTLRRLAANQYDWLAPKLSSAERRALDAIVALMDEGLRSPAPSGDRDVDVLANIIRTVDGSNTLGAGALAEAIIRALSGGVQTSDAGNRGRSSAGLPGAPRVVRPV